MNRILIPFFLFLCHTIHGQDNKLVVGNNLVWSIGENLVINPGFEEYDEVSFYNWIPQHVHDVTVYSTFNYFRTDHRLNYYTIPNTIYGYQEQISFEDNNAYIGFAPMTLSEGDKTPYVPESIGVDFQEHLQGGGAHSAGSR